MQANNTHSIIHLTGTNTSLVINATTHYTPSIIYWGPVLSNEASLNALIPLQERPVAQASLDQEPPLSLLPESSWGFHGAPGLQGQRARKDWLSQLTLEKIESINNGVSLHCIDKVAKLQWKLLLSLDPDTDVVAMRSMVTNLGSSAYQVQQLVNTLPLAPHCSQLMSFGGRWCREYKDERHALQQHAFVRENRAGRTSHHHFPGLMVGTEGFNEQQGDVYGFHLACSGNHQLRAERLFDGRQYLQMGELLCAGEVELQTNESYQTPWLYACFSNTGLQGISDAFHQCARKLTVFPDPQKQRPVHLNTWEALYFNHSPKRLTEMITAAADIGVERFIIDDGWFIGRDTERTAVGDWHVDERKYPEGLKPIIEQVHQQGMEFGLWFEPEMISPDSELYRKHPDWALKITEREQPLGRYQHVLNLNNPDAYRYIYERLDHFLSTYAIDYIKWDMNRDLVQAADKGMASYHHQTLAVHRLLDELRKAHPTVEIENCCSGGARANFEMLKYTQRIWTSDCNDALERQMIQRNFSYFFPPEIMGAHIGPARSHTTGRQHNLAFRSLTAFFGHLGLELDVTTLSATEKESVAHYMQLHKHHRHLLHKGRTIRLDYPDKGALAHGIVAEDRAEALFCYVQLTMPTGSVPAPLKLAGLKPLSAYHLQLLNSPYDKNNRGEDTLPYSMKSMPNTLLEGLSVSGELLQNVGIQLPAIYPESALLIDLKEIKQD